jgi:nitrous-oxide reductase
MSSRSHLLLLGGGLVSALLASACNPPGSKTTTAPDASAAAKSFVPPGDKDEFYLFYSGGHSGQVYVAGLPSMRHISTIPVFAPYSATGYGFDEESKKMLGRFTWGDVHHQGLSQFFGN